MMLRSSRKVGCLRLIEVVVLFGGWVAYRNVAVCILNVRVLIAVKCRYCWIILCV